MGVFPQAVHSGLLGKQCFESLGRSYNFRIYGYLDMEEMILDQILLVRRGG
jgi:hypothetical protein